MLKTTIALHVSQLPTFKAINFAHVTLAFALLIPLVVAQQQDGLMVVVGTAIVVGIQEAASGAGAIHRSPKQAYWLPPMF